MVELLRTFFGGLVLPLGILLVCLGVVVLVYTLVCLLRRSAGRKTWFILCAFAAAYYGGGKGIRKVRPQVPEDNPTYVSGTGDGESVEGLLENRPFRIVRIAHSNEYFMVESVWTNGFLAAGTKIDYLVKTNLLDSTWRWDGSEVAEEGHTNVGHLVCLDTYGTVGNGLDGLEYRVPPVALFVAVIPRLPVSDLRDSDGDGLPDNYEFHNGTNPWQVDYDLALRTRLDTISNLQEVLDRSAPYAILELKPGEYELTRPVVMPRHPVMLCASGPYAVIRSASSPMVFELNAGQTDQTLFRNLYIWLDARSGVQSAFWCGGNLPWSGSSASASFRDVYIRMPRPNIEYFGWHFYRGSANTAEISGCTVNAAGATWANGVYGYDPPPIGIRGCSFLNFPTNRMSARSCGIYLETSADNLGGVSNAVGVTVSNTLFDSSFTNALPLARIERGTNFWVSVDNCIVPSGFAEGHAPDEAGRLWTTNAGVAWCGIPLPGSLADSLGVGAHVALAPSSLDLDGDGDSDFVEAYERGTDPWLTDSDGDGVDDRQERDEGTDPLDGTSFLRSVTVVVTNGVDVTGTMTSVCWSMSPAIWEYPQSESLFSGVSFTTNYEGLTVSGPLYVKAFRDFNGDGVYTPGCEPYRVSEVGCDRALFRITFAFGDVDGDGVPDDEEYRQGTDPNDSGNFHFMSSLTVTNVDVSVGVTNYLFLGSDSLDDRADACFTGARWSGNIIGTVTNGRYVVACWRDLNRDGHLTPGIDTVYTNVFGYSANGRSRTFRIGDFDGDGVGDGEEFGEGTDVFGATNHCFNLVVTYTDIFQTTNALTFEARFGTNTVWGPAVVTNGTWSYDFGHCVAMDGEKAVVDVWDDVNENGLWDEGECGNRKTPRLASHNTIVVEALGYGNFDHDGDNLPDWWEVREGLSINGRMADEYADPDSDGMINLHEFWAGTHPLQPDGSNTLLSVLSRSIDERLFGRNPTNSIDLYLDYVTNGYSTNFVLNPTSWLQGIDLSCCSMWTATNGCAFGPTTTPVTVISPRHVIYAHHFNYIDTETKLETMPIGKSYYFRGRSGFVYERHLVGKCGVAGDIAIGLLDFELPTNDVTVAKILPSTYREYLGEGRYLPAFVVDQQERVYVGTCSKIPHDTTYHLLNWLPIKSRYEFRKPGGAIGGDSSSPKFMLLEADVILLGVTHKAGGFGGAFLTYYKERVQGVMNQLLPGTCFRLQEVDLVPYVKVQEKFR